MTTLPMPTRGPVYAGDTADPTRPYILASTASIPCPDYIVVFGEPTKGGPYWPALGAGGLPETEPKANRDLIAAAFNAAEACRQMGYDPIGVIEALPKLAQSLHRAELLLRKASNAIRQQPQTARIEETDLLFVNARLTEDLPDIESALAAARTRSPQC